MIRVTIKEIEEIRSMLRRINSVPLAEIEFDIPISPEDLETYRFMGLNNIDILEIVAGGGMIREEKEIIMNEIKIGEYTFNFNYPNGISKNDIQHKNIPVDVLASLNRWVEEPVTDGSCRHFYQPMGVCSAKDGKTMHTIFRVRDVSVNIEYEIEVEGYVKSLEQLPIDNVDNLELISRTELMI